MSNRLTPASRQMSTSRRASASSRVAPGAEQRARAAERAGAEAERRYLQAGCAKPSIFHQSNSSLRSCLRWQQEGGVSGHLRGRPSAGTSFVMLKSYVAKLDQSFRRNGRLRQGCRRLGGFSAAARECCTDAIGGEQAGAAAGRKARRSVDQPVDAAAATGAGRLRLSRAGCPHSRRYR